MTAGWGATNWYQSEMRMPPGNCAYLESLRPETARADAEHAVARGDVHLLGINGFTLEVPGENPNYLFRPQHKPVQAIECTGDYRVSMKHERLNEAAENYAGLYNRRVLELSADRSN
jgi:hypothetical protein